MVQYLGMIKMFLLVIKQEGNGPLDSRAKVMISDERYILEIRKHTFITLSFLKSSFLKSRFLMSSV